jgi:predicted SPOUT superfamily RNA methylase MTH1
MKRSFSLAIAIPGSLTSDIPHLREKTLRIGFVGRAAAIFRVDEIIIYPDAPQTDQKRDLKLIQTILSYMETPQYLRRKLFKIVPELQYAGTLPPLRTPHHPTANKTESLAVGEYREGVVVSNSREGSLVDIGVEHPALVPRVTLQTNTRVTVKITELGNQTKAMVVNPEEIKVYWGYKVSVSDVTFVRLLKKRHFDLVVATSRRGKLVSPILPELKDRWKSAKKALVAFGAPTQGLNEIAAHEHMQLDNIADYVVNTIPNQATETVRTEEAVYVTLSILNTLNG